MDRREALRGLATFVAGSPLLRAQRDPFRPHERVPGLDEMATSFDFEAVAFEKLDRATYNYTAHGTAGEWTVKRNRDVFDWVDLVPGPAAEAVDASTEVLGTPMQFPLMVAPSAAHLTLHPKGEHGMHAGATAAARTPMILSHVTTTPFAEVAANEGGPLWVQLYPRQEIEANRPRLDQAQEAGAQAVVVTVDQQAPYFERRLHDRHLSSASPGRRRPSKTPNPYRMNQGRLWYEWKLLDELRKMIRTPMLLKGVLTPQDALRSIDHGADGIVVSNHGGRALDYSPSTLEVLPEIAEAVGGRIPIIIDSGFRRGADVLKGLALGASAVCLGRVPRWALAAYGPDGVEKVLRIVQAELRLAMAQAGCADISSIKPSNVRTDFP